MRAVCALALLGSAVMLAGCPPEAPTHAPSRPPAVAKARPGPPAPLANGRLPALAVPRGYTLELEIDPRASRFHGRARIDVDVPAPTAFVVLHGRGLDVSSARLSARSEATAEVHARGDELVLAFREALPAGPASLTIDYDATFAEDRAGLFRVKDGARTQLGPTQARRVFPCFDEPSFAVPVELGVTVPGGMIAVATAPETARERVGARTRFRFARTGPLPTHALGLAVGAFEVAETTRSAAPPIRIFTTKGASTRERRALETTGALVDALGPWLGVPYPHTKLDVVVGLGPDTGASAGLVALGRDGDRALARAVARQWLGTTTTLSSWEEAWALEGLATWIAPRILDRIRPAEGAVVDAIAAVQTSMDEPTSKDDDRKSAAVLATVERWIGEDAFQRGVREWVHGKTTDSSALAAALDRASGKDVSAMAASYHQHDAVPEVSARLECDPGARWHVELSSQAWRPFGAKEPEGADPTWTIPACIRAQGEKKDRCVDLVAGAPSLVAGQGPCPSVVLPNARTGFYRFVVPERDFVRLATRHAELDVAARVSVLANAWAAVRSGAIEPKAILAVLTAFDGDDARPVVDQVATVLRSMSETIVDDAGRAPFRRFVLTRLAKRKKALGWTVPSVPSALADLVEDEATLREAEELAARWWKDPNDVDEATASVSVDLASRHAGQAKLTELLAATRAPERRAVALRAIVGFDDAALLEQALGLVLGGEIPTEETDVVLDAALARPRARAVAERWVRAHWDALRPRLGARTARLAASVGCSATESEEHATFYGPRLGDVTGALETIVRCTALRERGGPPLAKALATLK